MKPIKIHIAVSRMFAFNLFAPKSISKRRLITEFMAPCANTAGQILAPFSVKYANRNDMPTVLSGKNTRAPRMGYSG